MWFKNISLNNTLFHLRTLRDIFQTMRITQDQESPQGAFMQFLEQQGFSFGHADIHEFCYKMKNVQETDKEYIVPLVLAKALVQPYPSKHMIMAKLPEDLAEAVSVDYESGNLIDKLPTFEFHPAKEKRNLENGYVENIRYDANKQRLTGTLHAYKDKLSSNLKGYFDRREPIGVSIGFAYSEGPSGEFNGSRYDAAQKDLLLTHLALLPPNQAIGRCPLPLCGVGIDTIDSEGEIIHNHDAEEGEMLKMKKDLQKMKDDLLKIKNSLIKMLSYSLSQMR